MTAREEARGKTHGDSSPASRGTVSHSGGGSRGSTPTPSPSPGAGASPSPSPTGRATGEAATGEATANPPLPAGGAETNPIDPAYLTDLPFGKSSFWIQPWRAYLDTWPASRLTEALGINFDVHAPEAEGTARLLQESGFKLARIGINWDALSYEDPTRFVNEANIRTRLLALRNHDLRPLILLDANSTGPAPARQVTLTTLAAAPAGADSVTLSAASAAEVVPGKTGFDQLSFGGDPDVLVTGVAHDVATLSMPLPKALPAGEHKGATLLYAPFGSPTLADGEPNPRFEETLAGWLGYVGAVCREAASIFGPEGYDLEVWNELTFGSQFLNAEHYYSAAQQTEVRRGEGEGEEGGAGEEAAEAQEGTAAEEDGEGSETEAAEGEAGAPTAAGPLTKGQMTNLIAKTLLAETVAYVRNPANGIGSGVGITDGFADQTPFVSGAHVPVGLTALSKHLYAGPKEFPAEFRIGAGNVPLNALGERDTVGPRGSSEGLTPQFVPQYQSFFPEFYLSGVQTASIVRDLAPITTEIHGSPHGRAVGPAGGQPPQVWMTEYNINPAKAHVVGPDEVTPENVTLTSADKAHLRAKALLRSLVAMVGKGMSREYFFHAAPGPLSLIGEAFSSALAEHPSTYPGAQLGGETMTAFKNMLAQFQGPGPEGPTRQLQLLSITQEGDHAQFAGQGTAAHPSLYDREVLAVLPFQSSPTRFVIPVYVMTRDMLTLYEPNAPASDVDRFDLPDEIFHITLGNLPETATAPAVSAYDPLRDEYTPARMTSRSGSTATFEIAATDYPRILTIDFAPTS